MFEDVKKIDDAVVTGDPNKVEDMFGKVDPTPDLKSAVAGGRLTPVQGTAVAPAQAPQAGVKVGPPNPLMDLSQVDQWSKKRPRSGVRILLIVVAALIVTGTVAAYVFVYSPLQNAVEPEPQSENTNVVAPATEEPIAPVQDDVNTQAPMVPTNALIDTDGDGLTDLEEEAAGTDPMLVDTDEDGLNDRDEQRVYKTNPLIPDSDNDGIGDREEIFTWQTDPNNVDTDGDTYQDGVEIQNGYNPNGPGKLAPAQPEMLPEPPIGSM